MAATRMTTQRLRIMEYLRRTRTHPTAEQVHRAISAELPTITLATVYRNLNKLTEGGSIIRLKVGNTYHYDGKEGDHIHGICSATGDIVDIDQPELVRYVKRRLKHPGFTPQDIRIIVTGTCDKR
ncbi:transcriptional repressor [Candidatus Woesearchaeota archaeon]|nr:transcriptional repressor [Candidatus Woesearchaeota archaeon]